MIMPVHLRLGAICLLVLTACGPREEILEGVRVDLRAPFTEGEPLDGTVRLDADPLPERRAFVTPPQIANANWTHRAGTADHNLTNPALGAAPSQIWSANIGRGNGRKHRIQGDPVVADGRVFAVDSRAQVTSTSTGGERLWSRDLTPASDRQDDASGGGLAVENGVLFVSTAFGRLHALSAETGEELWVQRLDAVGGIAPTVRDGIVYVTGRDSRGWALDADTGRVRWQIDGRANISGVAGGAAPAVDGRIAVFPLASGELVGVFRQGGLRLWDASILGSRPGRVFNQIRDVTGDPVIIGDRVYAANASGRTVALDASSGDRVWTAEEGAQGPLWVAGGSVFLVSDRNELLRLDAETGDKIWGVELPFFTRDRPRRRQEIFAHYGPVLAGGRLVIASNDNQIRFFDPETGAPLAALPLQGGAASNPVVAGGTLYVLNGSGNIVAFR